MKKVNILVALTLCAVHVPSPKFEVDENAKTISGTVNSFVTEEEANAENPTPTKVSPFSAPFVDGLSDEDAVDQYLQTNITSVIGGTVVVLPAAETASAPATQA